jgi:gliding motility-associated-like protein
VNALPTLGSGAVGSDSPACVGESISLTAPTVSGVSYSWSGPNGFTSNVQNPSIASAVLSNGGTYTLTLTNTTTGCTNATGSNYSTNVVVNALPTLGAGAVGSNSPICSGDTLELFAPFIADVMYSWSGPNGFTSNVQNPIVFFTDLNSAGIYTLLITDVVSGCTNLAGSNYATSVVINPLPSFNGSSVSSNSPVCIGDSIYLFAPNVVNASYSWSGPSGFTSNVQNPFIDDALIVNSGLYTVILTDHLTGCVGIVGSENSVLVQVNNPPLLNGAVSSNSPLCYGSTLLLFAPFTPNVVYQWTGPNSFGSSEQNPVVENATSLNTGLYSCVVIDTITGCSSILDSTASVSVLVSPEPGLPLNLGANATELCAGDSLYLFSSDPYNGLYFWTGPNGFISSLSSPTISNVIPNSSGMYYLEVYQEGTECLLGVDSIFIEVVPNPSISGISLVSQYSDLCFGSEITLTASTDASNIVWTDIDGVVFLGNPFSTTVQNGWVVVTVNNGVICYNSSNAISDSLFIQGVDCDLVIPDVFTPNGDGDNDYFVILGLEKFQEGVSLFMFNRWGVQVYESTFYQNNWDGENTNDLTIGSQRRLPEGTYFYVIKDNSSNLVIKGSVYLKN